MAKKEVVSKATYKMGNGKTGACVLYSDGTIRVDGVRFSYPHLKKPYSGDDGGEPKFGIVGLVPKGKQGDKVMAICKKRIEELLKENRVRALAADKKFIRDGDEQDKEEAHGHYMISARETRRPPLRDSANVPVEHENIESIFEPGYWGSILIRPWFQNNNYGKRVNAGLSAVQMIWEDETFGEGRISEEELDDAFDSYDDDEDEEDDDDLGI